jgi:hypothetical protein
MEPQDVRIRKPNTTHTEILLYSRAVRVLSFRPERPGQPEPPKHVTIRNPLYRAYRG